MSAKTTDLLVRLPNEVVAALKAEKSRSHEPTSSFIRRAVIAALNPPRRVLVVRGDTIQDEPSEEGR